MVDDGGRDAGRDDVQHEPPSASFLGPAVLLLGPFRQPFDLVRLELLTGSTTAVHCWLAVRRHTSTLPTRAGRKQRPTWDPVGGREAASSARILSVQPTVKGIELGRRSQADLGGCWKGCGLLNQRTGRGVPLRSEPMQAVNLEVRADILTLEKETEGLLSEIIDGSAS